jgi:uncharacterized protein YbcI
LNAAISREVVRLYTRFLGRGPTKARSFFRDDTIVVILEDVMTSAERSLMAAGRQGSVRDLRVAFQEAMRPALIETIERLTGCHVKSFMSGNQTDPDMACEVFVCDRPVPGEQAAPVRS